MLDERPHGPCGQGNEVSAVSEQIVDPGNGSCSHSFLVARRFRVVAAASVEYSYDMGALSESLAFDRGVAPVLQLVLPDRAKAIVSYRPDPTLAARIEELAEKSTEGELTEEERAEYAGYVRANKFVSILKRQAERLFASDPSAR